MSGFIHVPKGYKCPLCPDHQDDQFVANAILNQPICRGCSHELLNLVTDLQRPKDSLLDRLEELTDMTYHEYQILELENAIKVWKQLVSKKKLAAFREKGKIEPVLSSETIDDALENIRIFRELLDHAYIMIEA